MVLDARLLRKKAKSSARLLVVLADVVAEVEPVELVPEVDDVEDVDEVDEVEDEPDCSSDSNLDRLCCRYEFAPAPDTLSYDIAVSYDKTSIKGLTSKQNK